MIKGRVLAADTGTPIRRALVAISGGPGGRGAFRIIYSDAAGRYEARDLVPGSYVISARPNRYQAQYLPPPPLPPSPDGPPRITVVEGQTIDGHDLVLVRAGAIVGRLVDEEGDPVGGVSVHAARPNDRTGYGTGGAQSSDEFGRYRLFNLAAGEYEIVAKPWTGGESVQGAPSFGFIDTYYPGTTSRAAAGRVRVRAGQEVMAGDLVVVRGRMLRVEGSVVDSQGAPAPQKTTISLASEGGGSSGTTLRPQGRFSFQPQAPGKYRVTARLTDDTGEITVEYASVALTLAEEDAGDLVISMKPTVTLTGRVVFDGDAAPTTIGADALSIRTQFMGRFGDPLPLRPAAVGADHTFTLRRIAGELLVRPAGRLMEGWTVKAVLLGNQDISDVPTEFRAGDSGRLQVVLTNRGAELSGTVTGDKGEPSWNSFVIVFGEDKTTWFGASTRFRLTRPNREGKFRVKGLQPGRYYMAGVAPVSWMDERHVDPNVLQTLVPDATAVVLGGDEHRVVDLRVIRY